MFPFPQKVIFLLLFLCLYWTAQAQDYLCKTEGLHVEDGLSNRFVRSIIQDQKGFMWFGTKHGLNRYDGNQFKVFTQEKDGLQSNLINQLYEDADGYLWIGYATSNNYHELFDAVDVLNVNTFEAQPIERQLKLPVPLATIYKIYTNPQNKDLYLSTTSGQIYIYKGKNEFELFYTHTSKTIIQDFVIGEQYYWLYTDNELLVLNKDLKLVQQQKLGSDFDENFCRFIGEIDPYNIKFLTYNKEKNQRKHLTFGIPNQQTTQSSVNLFIDTLEDIAFRAIIKQNLALGASVYVDRRRLALFDRKGNVFYTYSIPNHFIQAFFVDKQGNIWLGIHNEGLFKISYQDNRFKSYFVGESIRAITMLEQEGLLLANTYSGIGLYNMATKEKQFFGNATLDLLKSQNEKDIYVTSEQLEIEKFDVSKMAFVDTFFLSTLDEDKWKMKAPKTLASLNWAIHQDKNGRIWVGTGRGIGYIAVGGDSIRAFTAYNNYEELGTALVNYFYENNQGLWVASTVGLFLIDVEQGILRKYSQTSAAPYTIPHNYIMNIHEDKAGLLWLCTKGGGIIKLNPQTGIFEQFTTKQGLSHDVVYAILEDAYGHFWMSSDYGLMRFNPKTYIVNTYLPRDGLLHEEFNHLSAYKGANGTLYFGGVQGIIAFDPKDFLIKESYEVPLQVVRYQYFDSGDGLLLDKTKAFINNPQIVLDYTDRFFVLDFALLDFKANKDNHYAYKIEGLDEDWHFIDANSIRINGLGAGKYTLLIKGQGNKGVWSSSQLRIPILVKQPFYLTWQFFLVLFLIVLAYARWRVLRLRKAKKELEEEVQKRTQKIEEQTQELKELDNVKSRFFANISHELRTPLTLMLGPISAILEKHYGDDVTKIYAVLEMAKRNGYKLEQLIEEILMLSKLEANALEVDTQKVLFYPFIKRLFWAFEAQADLQGIKLDLDFECSELMEVLLDLNKLEKILNNLLSNALRHTSDGGGITLQVQGVAIDTHQVQLEISVKDTGKGISEQDLPFIFNRFYQSKDKDAIVQGGTGIGLALVSELTALMGGELVVQSKVGVGSTFKLLLKVDLVDAVLQEVVLEKPAALQQKQGTILLDKTKNKSSNTILVVEDNEDMLLFVSSLLSDFYQVITAQNGKIALGILESTTESIDLILSDVMMPEMDGFQLLQVVKADAQWRQIPVVLLTARAAEQDKLTALRIGVDDYLQKPFSRQELLVRIQNLLKNYQQRKTWQVELPKEELLDEAEELPTLEEEEETTDEWMEQVEQLVQKEVGNLQFSITSLADDLALSERHLRRKIKLKTGLSPNQYIRLIKLEVARTYLEKKEFSKVTEVANKIGFTNVNYFTKIYYEQYGKKVSDYFL